MKKIIAKIGMAAMAATMMMLMPQITAKAMGGAAESFYYGFPLVEGSGVAEEGKAYRLPGCFDEYETDDMGKPAYARITFTEDKNGELRGWLSKTRDEVVDCPAGYEVKSVAYVRWWGDEDAKSEHMVFVGRPWKIFVQNSQDWVKVDEAEFKSESIAAMRKFAVNYNGTLYQECKAYIVFGGGLTETFQYIVVPQGFDGAVSLTLYGSKWVDGEEVVDESSYLTYYLNGSAATDPNAAAAQQQQTPAAQQQQTPAAEQQQTPAASGQTYTTKSGDNLCKIAKERYGDSKRWKDIYELNKDKIKNPNRIWANMNLLMP